MPTQTSIGSTTQSTSDNLAQTSTTSLTPTKGMDYKFGMLVISTDILYMLYIYCIYLIHCSLEIINKTQLSANFQAIYSDVSSIAYI